MGDLQLACTVVAAPIEQDGDNGDSFQNLVKGECLVEEFSMKLDDSQVITLFHDAAEEILTSDVFVDLCLGGFKTLDVGDWGTLL